MKKLSPTKNEILSHLVPVLNEAGKIILIHKEFHEKVIQPFIIALTKEMKDAFDLSNLPVLNSFLKLDSQDLPTTESTKFSTYGEHEMKEFYKHYGTRKEDTFQERSVNTDALLDVPMDALLIEYAGFRI